LVYNLLILGIRGYVVKKVLFVLALLTGLVFGWSAGGQEPDESATLSAAINNHLDNWCRTWFVDTREQAGLEVPRPNAPFRWNDNLDIIEGGVAQEGDLCQFVHDSHVFIGLVCSVGFLCDQFPPATELTAFVKVPMGTTPTGVMYLMMAVEPGDIVRFLRPRKSSSPIPTPDGFI
jgi:hypothetical protein